MNLLRVFLLCVCVQVAGMAVPLVELPLLPGEDGAATGDWLVRDIGQKAGVYRCPDGQGMALSNGLIARTFRITPNAATVGLDNLVTGEAYLRGVKPEAVVTLNGRRFEVGGLKGQPNYAFLRADWLGELTASPDAMVFTGFSVGATEERFAWKRVRRHAPDAAWPPPGVRLSMDYAMPGGGGGALGRHSGDGAL